MVTRVRPNWYDNYSDMGTLLLGGDRGHFY